MPTGKRGFRVGKNVRIGGEQPLFLIGGPCVIEDETHALSLAEQIRDVCRSLAIPFIFKASFDKANRTSIRSYRGPGLVKGLQILDNIKNKLDIPVLSDIHETQQVDEAARVLDVLQIPAFLSRQTDLIVAAARTNKPLNIKKGPFLSPEDMKHVVEKAVSQGNTRLILTERGACFGYQNLVFDVRSIPIMKSLGFPVVIDASHSVQRPGGQGTASGGDAEFIPHIARAGVAAGADGVFLEIHDQPDRALSDGANSLILNKLQKFLDGLLRVKKALGGHGTTS
ncbi:MAG: 3-deoxy-8-phosphooctulonate synthase [Candidatus Aminicenantales bacterium]